MPAITVQFDANEVTELEDRFPGEGNELVPLIQAFVLGEARSTLDRQAARWGKDKSDTTQRGKSKQSLRSEYLNDPGYKNAKARNA